MIKLNKSYYFYKSKKCAKLLYLSYTNYKDFAYDRIKYSTSDYAIFEFGNAFLA